MKPDALAQPRSLPWFLLLACGLSLAANVALFSRARNASPLPESAAVAATAKPAARIAADRIDPETWTEFTAISDTSQLIERLRALGYPPGIIRALVRARVTEAYADRLRAIAEAVGNQPYWRGPGYFTDPKISAMQRAVYREINDKLRELLGPSYNSLSEGERVSLRRRFGDLAPEKVDALQQITSDYGEMMSEIRAIARGSGFNSVLLPDDREKLAFLEREQRADVAKILTPEELDAYDLRTGRAANTVRSTLRMFDPTEQEFLALYRLQKGVDDRFPNLETLTADQRRARDEALKALTPQIAAALGPERFAEYEKKTDYNWQNNQRFVREFDLPAETGEKLYALQKEIGERVSQIRGGNVTREQVATQLATLEAEATARLTTLLGDKLLPTYRNSRGGWLRTLEPPRLPPPKQ